MSRPWACPPPGERSACKTCAVVLSARGSIYPCQKSQSIAEIEPRPWLTNYAGSPARTRAAAAARHIGRCGGVEVAAGAIIHYCRRLLFTVIFHVGITSCNGSEMYDR
jgi:hypothetical protein